jgi:hypothetical protein
MKTLRKMFVRRFVCQVDTIPSVLNQVNNLAGFLGLFGIYEIETDSVNIEWLPDSETEDARLAIRGFRRLFPEPCRSPVGRLPPDLVARCILGARKRQNTQASLCFFRHGVEDLLHRRYVEAFYDFYFVLETRFANGKRSREASIAGILACERD